MSHIGVNSAKGANFGLSALSSCKWLINKKNVSLILKRLYIQIKQMPKQKYSTASDKIQNIAWLTYLPMTPPA